LVVLRVFAFVLILLSLMICHPRVGSAMDVFRPTPVKDAPNIDGVLDEAIWASAFEVNEFVVVEPDTRKPASLSTRFKMAYDQRALYLGVINEQPSGTQVRRISARDMLVYKRDTVTVILDPSDNGRYGYRFGVALGGSLMDGTTRPGSKTSFNWDAPWRAATSADDGHWYAEIEIPWDTMEWPDRTGKRQLGAFVRRQVSHLGEYWSCPPIPIYSQATLSELGKMVVHDINPRGRLTLYPYLFVGYDGVTQKRKETVGADAFWQPTSDLLISATINPDFGQVENDDVVVNFSATETFLQDKRPFFVEGNDIFQTTGRSLVHTRRIGQTPEAPDLLPGEWVPQTPLVADIVTAAKATGQKNNFRYGIMSAFEDDSDFITNTGREVSEPGSQFHVARALYAGNGSGSGYASLGYLGTYVRHSSYDAWSQAVDGHWLTSDRRYRFTAQVAVSDVDGEQGYAWNGTMSYNPRTGTLFTASVDHIDDAFDINDMGYIDRNDLLKLRTKYYTSTFDSAWYRTMSWGIKLYTESNDHLLAGTLELSFLTRLQNQMEISGELEYHPDRWDDLNSRGNGDHRVPAGMSGQLNWNTDSSKPIRLYLRPSFDTGKNGGLAVNLSASLGFDPMDTWQIGLSATYLDQTDWILWEEGNRMNGFDSRQLSFKIDSNYLITGKQEIRLGMQWVGIDAAGKTAYRIDPEGHLNQSGEEVFSRSFDYAIFSAQIRYKYEFAPLSDLFLVYSRGGQVYWGVLEKTDSMSDLLTDSIEDRAVDRFLIKVRYRF